jgi:hypothetical protein
MSAEVLTGSRDFEPRYDMTYEEVLAMTESFLEERSSPEQLVHPIGCYEIDGNDPYSNICRWLETEVFDETFKNDAARMQKEYGRYEHASTFFLATDHATSQPIGTMRIIKHSDAGLKTLVDLPHTPARSMEGQVITPELVYGQYGIDPKKCVDIATAAVLKDWRDGMTHLLLYRSLYLAVLSNKSHYSHIVSIMDTDAKRGLDSMHMPFRTILGSKPFSYLDDTDEKGSLSQAIIAPNHTFYPTVDYWQEQLDNEASTMEEFIGIANEIGDTSDDFKQSIEDITKQAQKLRVRALGMRLLKDGRDQATGLDIDAWLDPRIVTGKVSS